MTYNHASTGIRTDHSPFAEVADTGIPGGNEITAQAVPEAASRSDFASSAAMVNDILAARPSAEVEAPATVPTGPPEAVEWTEPTASESSAVAAPSSDFFASAKPKRAFWQKQLSVRRPRKGARS